MIRLLKIITSILLIAVLFIVTTPLATIFLLVKFSKNAAESYYLVLEDVIDWLKE